MFKSEKIAEANEKITALEGEKTQLTADLTAANEKVTKAESKITALEGEKTQLAADLKTALEKVTKAETDLKAEKDSQETKIEAEVVQRCSAAGVPPVKRDMKGAEGGALTLQELHKQANAITDISARARFLQAHYNELTSATPSVPGR